MDICPGKIDHSQSLPPLKLRETLPCLFIIYHEQNHYSAVVVYADPPMGIQAMVYNLQSFLDERCKGFFSLICLCDAIDLFCDGSAVHGYLAFGIGSSSSSSKSMMGQGELCQCKIRLDSTLSQR